MSRDGVSMPPPGVVNIKSLGNGKGSQDASGFAIPLPPSRPKVESNHGSPAQPVRKRKSRFSDAPPSSEAPPPKVLHDISSSKTSADKSDDNKAAAAAAAARINALLLAQGKIKTTPAFANQLTSQSTASTPNNPPNPALSAEVKKVEDMFAAEVEINDVPIGCRNYLTRLSTQEGINKSYMAFVSTRGKYMTSEEKKQHPLLLGGEKPLYLFVQSQNEGNLRKALERIRQIIDNHYEKKSKYQSEALAQIASLSQRAATGTPSTTPNTALQGLTPGLPLITSATTQLPHLQPALPSGIFVQEKVFIGMDSLPEHFDLKTKLLGPNYRNFNFISNQTGAKVILRGKGSGFIEPTSGREAFESMYAFVSHPNQAGVEAAKKLVLNLVETVKKQLPPQLRVTQSSPMGFSSSQEPVSYNAVPPPMPVPPPSTQTASVIAYPFQQTAALPVQTIQQQSQTFGEDRQVLGYQHNFPGSDYSSKIGSSSRSKSRKRFTEEPDMSPAASKEENKEEVSDPGKKESSLPFWMTN